MRQHGAPRMFKPLTKALELFAFLVLGVALRHYWPSSQFWPTVSSPVEPSSHRSAPLVLADRPNVVVVLLDDAGAGDAGALGHPLLLTPNIDAFVSRAVKFTQAYAGAPCCSPSRAVLLTGRASYRTGVYDFLSKHSGDMHMARTERTVASLLRDAGYATVHMGKWHLSHGPWGAPPSAFGFDHSNGSRLARVGKVAPPHVTVGAWRHCLVGACSPVGMPANCGRRLAAVMCGPWPLSPLRRLPASQLLQSFEGWLRTASSRPFFGYLALWEPHEPVQRWSPRSFQRWYSGPPRLPAVEAGGGEGGGEGEGRGQRRG